MQQAIKAKGTEGHSTNEEGKKLIFQLQLYGCTFRRAVRARVKRITSSVKDSQGAKPSAETECRMAADICHLVEAIDAAAKALHRVRAQLRHSHSLHGLVSLMLETN